MKESGEMYLETILVESKKRDRVRSVDVAEGLGVTRPSVSRAISHLKNGHYIVIDGNGFITLTDSGREIAEKIYERHRVLSALLMDLGVDEATATDDACRIEHVISDKTFEAIKARIKK